MPSTSKADKKAAISAAAWMFNVVTSVGIIIVNKALMAIYGFNFGDFNAIPPWHIVCTFMNAPRYIPGVQSPVM